MLGRRAAGERCRLYADNLIFIKPATKRARSFACSARSLVAALAACTIKRRAPHTNHKISAPAKGALRRKSIIVCPLSGAPLRVCVLPPALAFCTLASLFQLLSENVFAALWDEIYPHGSCSALLPKGALGCNFIAPLPL